MNKIKIAGIILFIVTVALVFVSINIGEHNKINNNLLEIINKQKAFTQEVSKNIFYIYKNKNTSIAQLNHSIKEFLQNMDTKSKLEDISSDKVKKQNKKIVILWNEFYLNVQKFREQNQANTPYIGIVLEKTVKQIYTINLKLIVEFDNLILLTNKDFYNEHYSHKLIQYFLFLIFFILLVILLSYIFKATSKIDFLIKKIDNTIKSIEQIENNAQDVLESIDNNENNELIKEEDAVIESLEELISSQLKLKKLQKDLENLIKLKN